MFDGHQAELKFHAILRESTELKTLKQVQYEPLLFKGGSHGPSRHSKRIQTESRR